MSSVIKEGLSQFFLTLQITPSAQQYASLEVFYTEIVRFSRLLGLTSLDPKSMINQNFLDSLLPISSLKKLAPQSVLDIGSGGGFPALCLAVFMPFTRFVLSERNIKKAGFLLSTASLMNLKNVDVAPQSFEEVRGTFDLCTSRALTKFHPKIVKKLLKKTSLCLAYKGRRAEAEAEKLAICEAGISCCLQSADTSGFKFPFERHFLWFGPGLQGLDFDLCQGETKGK